jgi:Fur family iron response transcriptional regulator
MCLGLLLFGKGHRHVTAEELFDEAVKAKASLTLATVYNTLHQFRDAGLLRQLTSDSSRTYFDTNTTDHHHYLLEEDGTVLDMPSETVTVTSVPTPPVGMEIARVDVIVRLRKVKDRSPIGTED